jgi:hypothetical protein
VRLIATAALAIVVWAALFGISGAQSREGYAVISAVIIALATCVRSLNGVQRWLASPKSRRKELFEGMAQVLVANICRGRSVTDGLLQLRVHVWEVPLWYRRFFPYKYRARIKRMLKQHAPKHAKLAIRPTLKRVAAYGLRKHPPSGVRFRKGDGLVGVCIANNDRSEVLFIDVSQQAYKDALALTNEADWVATGTELTRNLALDDAKKLSKAYGHVIAEVIQDPDTGEAIGCVTISLREANEQSRKILDNANVRRELDEFTEMVGRSLA